MGVSTAPGRMALTRMSSGANSIAIARVSASKPPFEAAYAAIFAEVWMAWTEETLTTAPLPALSSGYANLTPKHRAQIGCHDSVPFLDGGMDDWFRHLQSGVIHQRI